jgi:hypothetical protein
VVELKKLKRLLQKDASLWGYTRHKLRHDYFPSTQQLVLRMLTTLHNLFMVSVVAEITRQLALIATGNDSSADFAREIEHNSSSDIKSLDREYGKHSLDASFRHSNAQFPGVVLEVSYSQKRKDLRHLADDYILGGDENIRAVLGLDVEYNGRIAVLSMWRPGIEIDEDGKPFLVAEQVVTNQVRRRLHSTAPSHTRPFCRFFAIRTVSQ